MAHAQVFLPKFKKNIKKGPFFGGRNYGPRLGFQKLSLELGGQKVTFGGQSGPPPGTPPGAPPDCDLLKNSGYKGGSRE